MSAPFIPPSNFPMILGGYAFAFILSLLLTWVVRTVALRLDIVDRPAKLRKKHVGAIPLLGGLGPFLGFGITIAIILLLKPDAITTNGPSIGALGSLLIAGSVLVINGVRDDMKELSARSQFVGHLIAALIIVASGIVIPFLSLPGDSVLAVDQWMLQLAIGHTVLLIPWVSVGLTVAWIVTMINVTNLVDGMDGLLGTLTLLASLVIALVSIRADVDQPGTALVAAIFAAAVGGFLVWNVHPATIFAGTSGSSSFGFFIAVLAIISGSKIATAGLVMGLPVIDFAWVIFERWRDNAPLFQGDRRHLHLRLQDQGWSPWRVLGLYVAVSIMLGAIAMFFGTEGKLIGFGGMAILLLGFLLWRSSIATKVKLLSAQTGQTPIAGARP